MISLSGKQFTLLLGNFDDKTCKKMKKGKLRANFNAVYSIHSSLFIISSFHYYHETIILILVVEGIKRHANQIDLESEMSERGTEEDKSYESEIRGKKHGKRKDDEEEKGVKEKVHKVKAYKEKDKDHSEYKESLSQDDYSAIKERSLKKKKRKEKDKDSPKNRRSKHGHKDSILIDFY